MASKYDQPPAQCNAPSYAKRPARSRRLSLRVLALSALTLLAIPGFATAAPGDLDTSFASPDGFEIFNGTYFTTTFPPTATHCVGGPFDQQAPCTAGCNVCQGGAVDGQRCSIAQQCWRCSGGPNAGSLCSSDLDCNGGNNGGFVCLGKDPNHGVTCGGSGQPGGVASCELIDPDGETREPQEIDDATNRLNTAVVLPASCSNLAKVAKGPSGPSGPSNPGPPQPPGPGFCIDEPNLVALGGNGSYPSESSTFLLANLDEDGIFEPDFDGDPNSVPGDGFFSNRGPISGAIGTTPIEWFGSATYPRGLFGRRILAAGVQTTQGLPAKTGGLARNRVARPLSSVSGQRFVVGLYDEDGVMFTSFDGDGLLVPTGISSVGIGAAAHDVALHLTGAVAVGTNGQDLVMVRFNKETGQLDSSFGNSGKVILDLTGGTEVARALAIDAQDRIVVAGTVGTSGFLARFTPQCQLDGTFANGAGFFKRQVGPIMSHVFSYRDVAVDAMGRILVGGSATSFVPIKESIHLLRVLEDGSNDSNFGIGGQVFIRPNPADAGANAIAIDKEGRIIVAGRDGSSAVVVRLTEDGVLDTGFGKSGTKTGRSALNPSCDRAVFNDVVLYDDGAKIGAAGTCVSEPSPTTKVERAFVARFDGGPFCFDGIIDTEAGESDMDGDMIEDACDNCVDICNPDQADSQGLCADPNANPQQCGEACQLCPGHDFANQDPQCASLEYDDGEGLDCCFPSISDSQSTDPLCTGGGDVIIQGPIGPVNSPNGGPGDPPGGVAMKIPAGASNGEVFGVSGKNEGGKEHWLSTGGGTPVGSYEFTPHNKQFTGPDWPVVCMIWLDEENGVGDGKLDKPPYNKKLKEKDFVMRSEDAVGDGNNMTGKCEQNQCGSLDANGFPVNWNGLGNGTHKRTDDEGSNLGLRACCSKEENRYCAEFNHFSEYGLATLFNTCEEPLERPKLRIVRTGSTQDPTGRIDRQYKVVLRTSLTLGSSFDPEDAPFAPHLTGVELDIRNDDAMGLELAIEPGAYDKAAKKGWRVNKAGTSFQYQDKSVKGQLVKIKMDRNDKKDPNKVKVTVSLKGIESMGDALGTVLEANGPQLLHPVTVLIDTDPVHDDRCGEARFGEEGGRCIAKGTSIVCR